MSLSSISQHSANQNSVSPKPIPQKDEVQKIPRENSNAEANRGTNVEANREVNGEVNKATSKSDLEKAVEKQELSVEGRKNSTDAATLQGYSDVQVGAKSKPQVLTTKAVLEALNEALEPDLGPNAVQRAYEEQIDVSPEATAERIVSISTSFFAAYQEQHPEDDLETQLNNFIDVLSGGVDQGFGEAREILDGLGVLEGEIEENINKTYDLVFEGYEAFKQKMMDQSIQDQTKANTVSELTNMSIASASAEESDGSEGGSATKE